MWLAVALALAMPGTAQAILTIDLEWTATTGSGTIGSNVIDAVPGDELTLDIIVFVDSAGADAYALSVRFDDDGMDELDLIETIEFDLVAGFPCDPLIEQQLGPLQCGVFTEELFNMSPGIESEDESTNATPGLAGSFEADTGKAQPGSGPADLFFRIGQIRFLVTGNVATDGDDLEGSVLTLADGYRDNAFNLVLLADMPSAAVEPGFASVNAPEPSAALLGAVALATLLGLRRSTRLSVTGARSQ